MGVADRPVALVTGGSHRVGAAITRSLQPTHDLIVHSRATNPRAVAFVADLNQERKGSARLVTADLASASEIDNLVDDVGPRLDVLIHNASLFERCDDTFDAAWSDLLARHMQVNVSGPVALTHCLTGALRKAGELEQRPSLVVWILDTRRDGVFPNFSSYALSRAAGAAAVQMLAHALAPDVRVIGIAPGTVLGSTRPVKAISEATQKRHALTGPFGTPSDVVAAVGFAVSAPFLNATVIDLDGGKDRWST